MFKHFLKFITLPSVGTIEISEPIGFDKASYKVKQDNSRFGRDIIIANEDSELTFTRDFFEQLSINQILPNGDIINHASLGFDYLVDIFNNDAWEGKIEYILQKDNILFSTGIFSYATAVVDFDSIKVKIIQNTNREIIKRLEDTDVNAFSDKALDDRTIIPCSTTDILLKAKPIFQKSKWKSQQDNVIGGAVIIKSGTSPSDKVLTSANNANVVEESGVENTLSFFDINVNTNTPGVLNDEGFSYLYIQNELTNVTININNIVAYSQSKVLAPGNNITSASGYVRFVIKTGIDVDNINNEYILYSRTFGNSSSSVDNLPSSYTLQIPLLTIGTRLYIYAYGDANATFSSSPFLASYSTRLTIDNLDIEISGTSTAIDTVVKGVRLIDLAKHNTKSIADVQLIAPDYDINGEHYDNFAFNGLLLGQITNKPFNNKFKDLMNFSDETCSDIQINPTTVELLPYKDFYQDIEMATFDEIPSYQASSTYNKRYTLKTSDFKYKRSSDNRATNGQNSIDDVHTETQKYITENVDANLKVEINHIRSAFLIEEARRRAFDNEQTKSLENDDNLFLLKCVALAPNTPGGFSAVLLMRVLTGNKLEILNNNTNGDGVNFNWTLLGFSVGSQFFIDSGENIGTYTVSSITNSILTLQKTTGTPIFNGEALITMRWFYTNVLYTNQTNEGYTLIEGVSNPSDYSNLDYHWARNIQRWYPYLATATKFKFNGVIKTASFKTNGLLKTQKIGETIPIEDSADITNSIIASQKILTPLTHSVKVYSDFAKTTQLINDIQNVKGYVTIKFNDERTIKGYVKEMDYSWVTEELDLILEEKFEGDFMEITSVGVTYPQYPNKINLTSFQVNNIFVLLFDSDDVQMYPPVRFTNIKINGIAYTDITAFSDALTLLING
jgi:hypothetical protein